MGQPARRPFSASTQIYVFAIIALGATILSMSVLEIAGRPAEWQGGWLKLACLTLISGWLSVKLPSGRATISISETFVLAGTVLLGPGVGAVLVALDAFVLCTKEALLGRGLRWQQVAFNIASPAVSIYLSATTSGVNTVAVGGGLSVEFVVRLAIFTALYFLLNSWLVTFALSLELRERPIKIWWANFRELWINFAAGASIAAFAASANGVNLAFVGVTIPLLVVIYFTYSSSSKRVEAEREKVQELNRVFLSTVEALALAIDAKDQVTHGHIRRVQRYTMALAVKLDIADEKLLDAIRAAALLHDTGKLAVPEYILNKPGPLTAAEFERMKVHADVGADILKSINFPYPVEPIVRHHHEQWNGEGYPQGLKGHDIPLGARILAVVDCYDALTSDRPYRPRMTRLQAEQVLKERRSKAYDPLIVDKFISILDELEAMEAAEQKATGTTASSLQHLAPAQYDAISATTAEEREFNELRRELPRASSLGGAAEALFKHLRRVAPIAGLALYAPKPNTNEVSIVACTGVGAAAIDGLSVEIGDRISGWVFAHSQAVMNSDAALEIGPVGKGFSVPLRYAAAVPVMDRKIVGVMMVFSTEPLEKDHKRLLESTATLFVSSGAHSLSIEPERPGAPVSTEGPKSRIH